MTGYILFSCLLTVGHAIPMLGLVVSLGYVLLAHADARAIAKEITGRLIAVSKPICSRGLTVLVIRILSTCA